MAILDEQLITMAEAARVTPGRPHLSTLWRWATSGFRGQRLETVTVGGKRLTSKEAVMRFADATNRARPNPNTQRPNSSLGVLRRAGIVRDDHST
jgi:hypothetical protein